MEFFKQNTKIDFMGIRKWTALFSLFIFIISVLALMTYGLNFGLDFTGGLQIEAKYQQEAPLNEIRKNLAKEGYTEAVVQSYGNSQEVLISIRQHKQIKQEEIVQEVVKAMPGATVQQVNYIGPQVGKELATQGILAIIVAFLATMIYIALRFEYRFAVSSTLALIHDPILILGIFAFFQIEFNLPALAAVLAAIAYSLNDTIVVFDRVRENFRKLRKTSAVEILNISINQTLSRTIMTSVLTFIAISVLFLFGGDMIHSFATAMLIGIVIGTYSSIYVAGALAIWMGLNRKDFLPSIPKEIEDRP